MLRISKPDVPEVFEKYFYNIRFIYFCLLCIYTLCREIVPLHGIVGNELFSYFFFFIGLLIIGCSFFVDSSVFFKKNSLLMIAFIGVCAVSSLINIKFGLIDNIKATGWMMIYFFLAYLCGVSKEKSKYNHLTVIASIIVVVLGFFVAVSIPMYVYNVDYTYFNFNVAGIPSNQGFSSEYVRLWGVFDEANRGAVYSIVGIISAGYLFFTKKNIAVKILTALASVLFFSFVVLSQSRTAQFICIVACAWCVFYLLYKKLSFKMLKKISLSICAALISAILFYCAITLSGNIFPYIKQFIYNCSSTNTIINIHKGYDSVYRKTDLNITNGFLEDILDNLIDSETHPNDNTSSSEQPGTDTPSTEQPGDNSNTEPPEKSPIEYEELKRPDVNDTSNLSNGRIRRWKEGLIVFSKAPVFGTSPRGVSAFAKVHCPETYIAKYNYVIHNGYLEVLTGTGILGFILIMAIFVSAAIVILSKCFKQKFDLSLMFLTLIIIIFCGMSLLQTEIFFVLTFGGSIFWYAIGTASHLKEKNE